MLANNLNKSTMPTNPPTKASPASLVIHDLAISGCQWLNRERLWAVIWFIRGSQFTFLFFEWGEYDSTRTRRVGLMDTEGERCNVRSLAWKVFRRRVSQLAVAPAVACPSFRFRFVPDNNFDVRNESFGEKYRK